MFIYQYLIEQRLLAYFMIPPMTLKMVFRLYVPNEVLPNVNSESLDDFFEDLVKALTAHFDFGFYVYFYFRTNECDKGDFPKNQFLILFLTSVSYRDLTKNVQIDRYWLDLMLQKGNFPLTKKIITPSDLCYVEYVIHPNIGREMVLFYCDILFSLCGNPGLLLDFPTLGIVPPFGSSNNTEFVDIFKELKKFYLFRLYYRELYNSKKIIKK